MSHVDFVVTGECWKIIYLSRKFGRLKESQKRSLELSAEDLHNVSSGQRGMNLLGMSSVSSTCRV
jgi:hypothetical protein